VTYLVVAVVILAVACFVNMLLLLGVTSRVRKYADQLATGGTVTPTWTMEPTFCPLGSDAPVFVAIDIAGERRSLEQLRGRESLIAFLSVQCEGCRQQLTALRDYALSAAAAPSQVVVILNADETEHSLIGELASFTTVVTEPYPGPIAKLFSVNIWPTFYHLDADGVIVGTGLTVQQATADRVAA
jgi:hypothetical protein